MTENNIATISPVQAQQKAAQGAAIIDVREYPEWVEGHIPNSTLIPLGAFADEYSADGGEILLLCGTGKRAAQAAQIVAQQGGKPLIIEGGLNAWKQAGLEVQKSENGPISIERQVRIGAGSLVLLGLLVPKLRLISAFAGCGLIFSGITDFCGMARVLAKMPWNQNPDGSACGLTCDAKNEAFHG